MSSLIFQSYSKRAVSSLSSLSNDELDEYINNDEKFEEFLSGLDQSYLSDIINNKESLMESNKTVANATLAQEPELVEGREKLQKLNEQAEELSKIVEEKTKELRTKNGDLSLEVALALLQTAASEIEEESDNYAKNFLKNNEIELDEFIDQFLIKRKLMHLRLVKAEKLAKILSVNPSGIPNYVNTPPLIINSTYFPGVPIPSTPPTNSPTNNTHAGGVPYPTGPFMNMPMPPPPVNYFQNHY